MANQTKIELSAQKRTVTGKHVKQMRKESLLPANIFGPAFESKAITIQLKEFTQAYKQAHETGIVYITVDNQTIPTLVKHIQRHPVNNDLLHVDFRKVDLTQKVETEVPIQTTGTSMAVSQLGGVLLTQADHLLVEALPQNIPPHIDVDITPLAELGQEIKVQDLPKSSTYEIKEDPEKVIVSVVEHKEESLEAQTITAAPEITSAKPEEAEGEGAAEAETEEKK